MRLRAFLGMWIALALAGGLTVIASGQVADGGRGGDQTVSSGSAADGSTVTTRGAEALGPGQIRVAGSLTSLHLEGALLDPREVPTPLTIVSARGFGNGGELTRVLIDGEPSSIVWDGGRPFVLSGTGALVPDPVVVDLVPAGVRLALGGANHRLRPGTYRLDTPVAVGRSGVATPRDSVTFVADARSLFEARGDASLVLGPEAPRRLNGPGRVELVGALELTDSAGTRATTALTVDRAAFDLRLTPDATGHWTVAGLVDSSAAP